MAIRATLRLASALLAAATVAPAAVGACPDDPRRPDLSPWVGEWRMVGTDGAHLGTTSIRPILDGCAYEEVRQRSDGSEERGWIYFDPEVGEWALRWVSSRGETGRFRVAIAGDRLLITGDMHGPEGGATALRSEIAPRAGSGFGERLEVAVEDGDWAPPLVTAYLPLSDQPPATAPTTDSQDEVAPVPEAAPLEPGDAPAAEAPAGMPEPAAESSDPVAPLPGSEPVSAAGAEPPAVESPSAQPSPAPSVKVRSDRLGDTAVVEMVSPMTLELVLGPLGHLPPEAAWTSDELEPYIADAVHITRVAASHRQRRKTVEIELTLHLHTRVFQRKVDVTAALLSDDEVLVEAHGENIALGKLIASHDPKTGRPYTLVLPLEAAAFDALFADDHRPSVRLTIIVQ
jgi:hypothetical protein